MRINVENEKKELEQRYFNELAQLPVALRGVSLQLARRSGFGSTSETDDWCDRFSMVALMYPTLQAEGVERRMDHEMMRRLNLAHLLFLIHSIIEDRQVDGQITLTREETLFDEQILLRAVGSVSACLGSKTARWSAWLHSMAASYAEAQLMSYGDVCPDRGMESARLNSMIASRSIHGVYVPIALHLRAGFGDARVRQIIKAFEPLVVGLQWADDLSDWREDRAQHRDNLLLFLLDRLRSTINLPSEDQPGSEQTDADLLQHGVYWMAYRKIVSTFRNSSIRHRRLGCNLLADLIDQKIEFVKTKYGSFADVLGEGLVQSLGL